MHPNFKFAQALAFNPDYLARYLVECEQAGELEITLAQMLHYMSLGVVPSVNEIAPLYLHLACQLLDNREEVLKLLSGSGPAPSP